MKRLLISLLVLAITSISFGQTLAFPGAKGIGAHNTGGTDGVVYIVDRLTSSPTDGSGVRGSFLYCLNQTGPRVITFEVGGTVDLRSETGYYDGLIDDYVSGHNNVTIAGQTAPGGITFETYYFSMGQIENLVMRYIRNKHVDLTTRLSDGASFTGNNYMFDHCTWIGGDDEVLSIYDYGRVSVMPEVTIQRNMFANGKTGMILGGVYHNYGTDPAGSPQDLINNQFTVLNNLWVDISHRFPNASVKGGGSYDIINNVIYNPNLRINSLGATTSSPYGSANADMYMDYNFIGNYIYNSNRMLTSGYGPGLDDNQNEIQEWDEVASIKSTNVEIYSANNVSTGVFDTPQVNDWHFWQNFDFGSYDYNTLKSNNWFTTTQHPLLGQSYPIESAADAYTNVMSDVGANAYINGSHVKVSYTETLEELFKNRVLNDSSTEFGGWDSVDMVYGNHTGSTRPANWDTDNDGMPDTWETAEFGNLTQTSWGDFDSDGVPNLYEYLNIIDGGVVNIDVTGVTDVSDNETINIPNTVTLTKTILPSDASDQSGTWSSSDNGVASVDQSGIVSPVAVGQATITFTTNDGSFTDSCLVTVTNNVIDVTSVTLDRVSDTVTTTDVISLGATVLPSDATNKQIDWSTSDSLLATVDTDGIVTPISNGTVTITAASNDDNQITDTYVLTINLPTGATVTSAVSSSLGDVKEVIGVGTIFNSDGELGNDIGTSDLLENAFHFPNPGVPSGKTIQQAYITLYPKTLTESTGTLNLRIDGEDSASPQIYTTTANDVSGRSRTTENVSWSPADWTTTDPINTPDLSAIVQEQIDRVGYDTSDAFNFMIDYVSGSGTRNFFTQNYDSDFAPVLTIIYDDGDTNVAVTGATISSSAITVKQNKTATIVGGVLNSNATNKTGFYTSDDLDVFTIDSNGIITPGEIGTGTGKWTTNDGGFEATFTVTVEAPIFYVIKRLMLKRVIGL